VAAEAADAAVKNAVPMTQNGYKVQLARTTVMRAIMKAAKA
jgi:CO/xanthine dehydrogenase FAD-binding subunit